MRHILLSLLFLASCTSKQHAINHVVFIELNDATQIDAIITDSDARLASIPTVKDYFCGTHVPSGRDSVLTDYDVAVYFAFDSMDAYQEYVNHPNHIGFVEDWKPKLKSLRVYDISD